MYGGQGVCSYDEVSYTLKCDFFVVTIDVGQQVKFKKELESLHKMLRSSKQY